MCEVSSIYSIHKTFAEKFQVDLLCFEVHVLWTLYYPISPKERI